MNTNKKTNIKAYPPLVGAVVFALSFLTPLVFLGQANAATPFAEAFVRLDNLNATSATTGRVCVKTTASDPGTEASVQVTFPVTSGTSYVVNATAANWTVSTTNLDAGQTAWPGIATATAVSGNTVTFPSTALTANTLYCFNWTGASTLTTSSAGASETTQGNVATYTTASALINQTTYSESIITNDNVVVNAVVPPSFAFALSGNTDSFTANLTPATVVSTTGRTITVTTNAASGYIVWAKDANNNGSGEGSLHSATANSNIAGVNGTAPGTASAALATTSANYGLGATVNSNVSGTLTINAAYDGTTNKAGTLDPVSYYPVASGTKPANGDVINVNERANSTATTAEASDYTDTITFTGAGEF